MDANSGKRRSTRAFLIAATALSLGATAPARAQSSYTFNNLGSGTIWSFGYGVNNSGQTVGQMDYRISAYTQIGRAFRTGANQPIYTWSDDMGTLSGSWRSAGYGINDNGDIVGEALFSNPTHSRAIVKTSSGIQDLHVIPGAVSSVAYSISQYGWVVGSFTRSSGLKQGFLSFGPSYTYSLESWLAVNNVAPAESEARGSASSNTADQIVGWRRVTASSQPLAYRIGVAGGIVVTDLGTLPGGIWSKALAASSQNHVVGTAADASGRSQAFLWKDLNNNNVSDPGEMQDLDTINSVESVAYAVNASGYAVGYYGGSGDVIYGTSRACLFRNGTVVDLNAYAPAGWTLRAATGINDSGQIVGWAKDPDGNFKPFRLDPVYRIIIIRPWP